MFGLRWFRRSESKADRSIVTSPAPVIGFDDLFGSAAQSHAPIGGHVVIVGNCLAEGIQMGMSSAPAARKYSFSVIPLHLRSIEDIASKKDLARATHVVAQRFHAVDVSRLTELVAIGTPIIEYQDVVFRSAWPFDDANGFKDDAMLANPNSRITHADGALAVLRTLEPDKKKRIQRYKNLDFDLANRVDRIIETQERFLESIDDRPDLALGRFIADNFRSTQLFYSTTHPSGALFQAYCEHVWGKLQIPGAPPSFSNVDHWREWSVPVHPLIARRLGLRWADETTRYHYGLLGKVTWLEWVEAYVEAFG